MKQSDRQDGVRPHIVRDASAPMFGTLLASSPPRDTRRAAVSLIGSMLAHTTIVAALAWATMAVGQEILEEEQVTLIELPPETAPPPPPICMIAQPLPQKSIDVQLPKDEQQANASQVPRIVLEIAALDAARGVGVSVLGAVL